MGTILEYNIDGYKNCTYIFDPFAAAIYYFLLSLLEFCFVWFMIAKVGNITIILSDLQRLKHAILQFITEISRFHSWL